MVFSGRGLWTVDLEGLRSTGITTNDSGDVFSIIAYQNWIVKINASGYVTTIPFSNDFELNEFRLRLFVDSEENIWMNACLHDYENTCLVYYQNISDQWYSFVNLPFSVVADITQLSDGSMLMGTNKGLYRYRPND